MKPRSRRAWLGLLVVAAALFAGFPFLLLATLPADAAAPARIAPYVDAGRQSLISESDAIRNLPHHLRYVAARCSGNGVALLFEVRTYPFLATSGAYAVNGDWPPGDTEGFGGAFGVEDFDASLRDGWVTDQPWTACEPA